MNWNTQYYNLLNQARSGYARTNKRTKEVVHTIAGGVSFKLDLDGGRIPIPGNRTYWPHLAAAELAWMLIGTKDAAFIMKHAPKLWGKFLDSNGEVAAAYGYRWTKAFGRNQLLMAVEALKNDSTNRQIWVQAWDPWVDGLGDKRSSTANVPCPIGFTLNVLNNQLHMSLFIRSSDLVCGLPYDVMCYSMLAHLVAYELCVVAESLHVTLADAHYYGCHQDVVDASLKWTRPEESGASVVGLHPLETWTYPDLRLDGAALNLLGQRHYDTWVADVKRESSLGQTKINKTKMIAEVVA